MTTMGGVLGGYGEEDTEWGDDDSAGDEDR